MLTKNSPNEEYNGVNRKRFCLWENISLDQREQSQSDPSQGTHIVAQTHTHAHIFIPGPAVDAFVR